MSGRNRYRWISIVFVKPGTDLMAILLTCCQCWTQNSNGFKVIKEKGTENEFRGIEASKNQSKLECSITWIARYMIVRSNFYYVHLLNETFISSIMLLSLRSLNCQQLAIAQCTVYGVHFSIASYHQQLNGFDPDKWLSFSQLILQVHQWQAVDLNSKLSMCNLNS